FEKIGTFTAFACKPLHDTAGSIAASLGLGAVPIDNLDKIICSIGSGIMDSHDLIKSCFFLACQMNSSSRRNPIGAPTHIGNNDLVAQSVHFGEDCLI